jgi:hypothetical protein
LISGLFLYFSSEEGEKHGGMIDELSGGVVEEENYTLVYIFGARIARTEAVLRKFEYVREEEAE